MSDHDSVMILAIGGALLAAVLVHLILSLTAEDRRNAERKRQERNPRKPKHDDEESET